LPKRQISPPRIHGWQGVERLKEDDVRKLYWWLFIIRLSLRWIPRFNIGDMVIYKGQEWMLIQGVCDPEWDLIQNGKRIHFVHQSEFRKVRTIKNYWRSFNSGYHFYMGYWYKSWVRGGIKDWMRGCNIWANRLPKEKHERRMI